MSGPRQPASRRRSRIAVLAAVATLVVVADQITKSLALSKLATHDVHVFGPFYFRLTFNTGVAFSIGTGLTGLIIVVAVVLVLAVLAMARGAPSMPAAVAFGLVLGGAVGNLSDRLFRSHHRAVVDFIYTRFWPTFNVADSCIVIGCIVLAVSFARAGRSAARQSSPPADAGAKVPPGPAGAA